MNPPPQLVMNPTAEAVDVSVMNPTAEVGDLRIESPDWLTGSRRVRLHDCSPARDVPGSDDVGGPGEAAPLAGEPVPAGTVGLVNVPASRTLPAGVPRVHQYHRDTGDGALVDDERPELEERPGCMIGAPCPVNRGPVADPAQVFELDPAAGALGIADDVLADDVVDVPGEPGFLPPPFGEKALSGFGAFGLESGAELTVPVADRAYRFPAVGSAIGGRSDVDDAEVHAEPLCGFGALRRVGDVDDDSEVELSVPEDQVGGAPEGGSGGVQPPALVDDGDDDPAGQGQDGYPVAAFPRQDPLIVGNGAEFPEFGLDLLVPLVRLAGFRDGADGHLGGQAEGVAEFPVDDGLEPDLVRGLVLERNFGDTAGCGVARAHRREQSLGLLRRRGELQQLSDQHTIDTITQCQQSGDPR